MGVKNKKQGNARQCRSLAWDSHHGHSVVYSIYMDSASGLHQATMAHCTTVARDTYAPWKKLPCLQECPRVPGMWSPLHRMTLSIQSKAERKANEAVVENIKIIWRNYVMMPEKKWRGLIWYVGWVLLRQFIRFPLNAFSTGRIPKKRIYGLTNTSW